MLFLSGAYDAGTHALSGALASGECWGQASAPPIPLFSPGTPALFMTLLHDLGFMIRAS
jgi:hypothetical protein